MKEENENENENDDIHAQTENMLKKIEEQMRLSKEVLNINKKPPKLEKIDLPDISKSEILPKKNNLTNQNLIKIKDSALEFVNLEENFSKKPDNAPFDDFCSICSSKIYYIKYICIVCKDCILCQKCEGEHKHPVLKCKFNQLSTLEDIYTYINNNNTEIKNNQNNNQGFLSNFFFNKCEFKLECNSNSFSMRPNSQKFIPISITNLSNAEINCLKDKVVLFGRNSKDLNIYTVFLNNIINKSEQIDILIKIESNDICKIYDFTIELFSLVLNKLKSNVLNFKVEINNDKEDEELNNYFKEYPKITIESKNIKKGVKKILEDTNNKFNPIIVMQYLKNNNGNIDETFSNLTNNINNINNNIIN